MKNFLIIFALAITACHPVTTGPELTEQAEILETCFVPKGHGSDISVGYNTGKDGGVTITPIDIDIPARFAIVFKCQHGKFVIEGDRAEKMWHDLDKGDKVVIHYAEKFQEKDGVKKVVGLHFLKAEKMKPDKKIVDNGPAPVHKPAPPPMPQKPNADLFDTDTGAAAALRRVEARELSEANEVTRCERELERIRGLDTDDPAIKAQLSNAQRNLSWAKESHGATLKQLLNFDKSVSPEKREGVKLSQSEAETAFENITRFARLGAERFLTSFCQDAVKCDSAEAAYTLGSERFRDTITQSIQSAVANENLPAWAKSAAERGL